MPSYTIIASGVTESTGITYAAASVIDVVNTSDNPMVLMQSTGNPGNATSGVPLRGTVTIAYPVAAGNTIYVRGTAGSVIVVAP